MLKLYGQIVFSMKDSFGAIYSDDWKILKALPDLNVFQNGTYSVKEGCETIEWNDTGFVYCLKIPKTVKSIIFKKPNSVLKRVYVDSENPYFTSIDGNLYDKDGKELLMAINWEAVNGIPMIYVDEDVKSIANNAFLATTMHSYFNTLLIYSEDINVKNEEKIYIPNNVVVYVKSSKLDWANENLYTKSSRDLYLDTIENFRNTHVFRNEELITVDGCILTSDYKKLFSIEDKTIRKIRIPEGVKYIAKSAFRECYNLEDITFPSTLLGIGDLSFRETRNLKSLSFPEATSYIGNLAFAYGPKFIEFKGKIEHIGYQAFVDCNSVESIIFHKGFESIKNMDFSPSLLDGKSIRIPKSFESKIPDYYKEWKYNKNNPWYYFEG